METLTRPGEHALMNPPAVAFSSVMGICGLGLSWRAAGQVLAAPRAIGEWLIAVGVMLFIVLSALYGIKTVRHPSIVAAEFRDPGSASNFACITTCRAATVRECFLPGMIPGVPSIGITRPTLELVRPAPLHHRLPESGQC
jgi:tellurite resistance protein TehA-like permease